LKKRNQYQLMEDELSLVEITLYLQTASSLQYARNVKFIIDTKNDPGILIFNDLFINTVIQTEFPDEVDDPSK